tara:strand:+ start:706 stop:849 length:144 start_codon:yes stop_codon:yes gene_type:complete
MAAAANNLSFAKKANVSQEVAKEYNNADRHAGMKSALTKPKGGGYAG